MPMLGAGGGLGLIQVKNNEQLDREAQEARDRAAALERQSQPAIQSLAAHVKRCWEAAKRAKEPIEQLMLKALRQRAGQYDPAVLADIQADGGNTTFMRLTDEKCNAAESWIEDILLPADDKPWGVSPTPEPELSPQDIEAATAMARQAIALDLQDQFMAQVEQTGIPLTPDQIGQAWDQRLAQAVQSGELDEMVKGQTDKIKAALSVAAKKKEEAMELRMDDKLTEAGWRTALRPIISDIVTFKAGILKGPVPRNKKEIVWGEAGAVPQVEKRVKNEYDRVSPFDIYPAPSSIDVDDGYMIERHRLTRGDLRALLGVRGYDDEAIKAVLTDYGRGGLSNWLSLSSEQERARLEGRELEWNDPEGKIEALQFWGSVQGRMLLEYGLDPADIPDPLDEYQVEVWLIGSHVIKAELNGDYLGRNPYFKASFRDVPGSFWGMGLPEIISDIQDICNAVVRAMCNNMALGSGPMVGVDVGDMPEGETVTELHPRKIFQFNRKATSGASSPIWFFQPEMRLPELIRVYEFFTAEADNKSGVPRYSYGSGQATGALATATGMSMMMSAASRGIKKVVRNIDSGIIEPSVSRLHDFLMLYDPDPAIKGDIKFVARGSSKLVSKEQVQLRRTEALNEVKTDAIAQQIIGPAGYAKLLREWFSGLGFDPDIIPSQEEIERQLQLQAQQQAAMAQAQLPPGQAPAQGQETNPAGDRVGGQDVAQFQGGPQ